MEAKTDRVALVTGASSGIGEAAAHALVGAGFTVYGTSRRATPGEKRGEVVFLPLDVTDDESEAASCWSSPGSPRPPLTRISPPPTHRFRSTPNNARSSTPDLPTPSRQATSHRSSATPSSPPPPTNAPSSDTPPARPPAA